MQSGSKSRYSGTRAKRSNQWLRRNQEPVQPVRVIAVPMGTARGELIVATDVASIVRKTAPTLGERAT
jgi:hypothetical protein